MVTNQVAPPIGAKTASYQRRCNERMNKDEERLSAMVLRDNHGLNIALFGRTAAQATSAPTFLGVLSEFWRPGLPGFVANCDPDTVQMDTSPPSAKHSGGGDLNKLQNERCETC